MRKNMHEQDQSSAIEQHQPLATANIAIHCLKLKRVDTKPMGTSYNLDEVWSGAPDVRCGK